MSIKKFKKNKNVQIVRENTDWKNGLSISRTPTIENKLLPYSHVAILKPISTCDIRPWGCADKFNIDTTQRCRNTGLRTYRSERNEEIHRDMVLPTIAEEIRKLVRKHEMMLDDHVDPTTRKLRGVPNVWSRTT